MPKPKPNGWIIYREYEQGRRSYRMDRSNSYSERVADALVFATRAEAVATRAGDFQSSGVEPIERAKEREVKPIEFDMTDWCFWCKRKEDPVDPSSRLTEDHVPPKGLFLKHVWNQIGIVFACRKCNGDWHLDSDYFREALVLILKKQGSSHPDLPALQATIDRAKAHRTQKGRRESLFERRSARVGSGRVLEMSTDLIDPLRLVGVLKRCVWAIEQYHQIPGVPEDTYMYGGSLLTGQALAHAKELIQRDGRSVAHGRFKYSRIWNAADINDRQTLLSFYDDAVFALTCYPRTNASPYSPIEGTLLQRQAKGYMHAV